MKSEKIKSVRQRTRDEGEGQEMKSPQRRTGWKERGLRTNIKGEKKTDGNRQIKVVRQTKMRKFKERFSVSRQLFLCAQMTDITWQVLITAKLKRVQKHTQRSHRLCLIQIWWFGIFCNKKYKPPSYWVLFWYFQIQSQSRRWYLWTKHKILKVTPASASNFFFVTGLKYWPPSVEPRRKSP